MTVLTEGNHAGEYIVSLANGYRSTGEGVVASGLNLVAGAVVQLTGGEYIDVVDAASDPVAILYDAVDATLADTDGVFTVRDAEVAFARLTYPVGVTVGAEQDAVNVRLLAAGIKVV